MKKKKYKNKRKRFINIHASHIAGAVYYSYHPYDVVADQKRKPISSTQPLYEKLWEKIDRCLSFDIFKVWRKLDLADHNFLLPVHVRVESKLRSDLKEEK